MKNYLKPALIAGITFAAALPAVAQAQVAGIATSSPEATVFQAQARTTAYQQIGTTYAAQIQQISTLRGEIQTLSQTLDTNSDNQLSQQEADANPGVRQQIEQKQQQADTLSQPIVMAQYYVIEQVLGGYGQAQQQVIAAKNIQIMLTPEAFQYAAEGVDVTQDILAALNQQVPTAVATPPANYQPRRNTVAMHQAVQQLQVAAVQRAAAIQQQQQQQQNAAQQPAGR